MKKETAYFNRDEARIPIEEWDRLRKDKDYPFTRQYDNDVVLLQIEWVGKIEDYKNSYRDMWKMFRLNVYNYNAEGVPIPDPVEHGRWFPTRKAADAAYEEFVERWTNSYRDEDGIFVEEDNSLTPPPPPDPNAPSTDLSEVKGLTDDSVGAW